MRCERSAGSVEISGTFAGRRISDVSRDLTGDVSRDATDDTRTRGRRRRVPRLERPRGDRPSPTSSPSPEFRS